jgi:sarcosine oxidase/L-pipecolate oxidase
MASELPESILIIGCGVFGLSTAYSLSHHPSFQKSRNKILLISPTAASSGPTPWSASVDSSRIVRSDYADPLYTHLGMRAMEHWRGSKPEEPLKTFENDASREEVDWKQWYTQSGVIYLQSEALSEDNKNVKDYVGLALENNKTATENKVEVLTRADQIASAIGLGSDESESPDDINRKKIGSSWSGIGFVNWSSGWANAEGALQELWQVVKKEGLVNLRDGIVSKLKIGTESDRQVATGVVLSDGNVIPADLVIVAAGAWSPSQVDLSGQAAARGQVMAYLKLSDVEFERLRNIPVILSLKTGMFVIPPTGQTKTIKIARHAYGYTNYVQTPYPMDHSKETMLSVPGSFETIPEVAEKILRTGLADLVPWLGLQSGRQWSGTRTCWYCDT